jgi:dipeptidyl aminopeptidase/acylaminoacyl peptidase
MPTRTKPPIAVRPAERDSIDDVPRVSGETEALIEEARQRQRRRRLRLLVVVVTAAGASALAFGIMRHGGGSTAIEHVPNGPVVNISAFAHHGSLAFISRNALWVLDGTKRSLHRMPPLARQFTPQQPVFSPDGRWLAYLVRSSNGFTPNQLWIANGDGIDAHVVSGVPIRSVVGWSPRHDLLAFLDAPERSRRPCPCFTATTLRVVVPGGSSRILVRAPWVYGAVWSPPGDALAVTTVRGDDSSALATYPVNGARPTVWLAMRRDDRLNGMRQVILGAAGWWKNGIGVWVFGNGMIHNNDATPLDLVGSPGARPRLLGHTLSDGTTDVVAASSTGSLAIVTDHGGGRSAWQDKQVELCSAAGRCKQIDIGKAHVTVDPVWLPDGKTLAFVEAPNNRLGPWTQKNVAAWFSAHRVWLYNAAGGKRRELAAVRGATALTWSHDGGSLLYVKNNSLWLLPKPSGRPVEIVAPLFPPGNWPQYYAQIPWAAQFAWSMNR